MNIVNLTPHTIVLHTWAEWVHIPSSGVARVSQEMEHAGWLNGWRVRKPSARKIEGLPPPTPGTVYIVSNIVLNSLPRDRKDCVAPDTGIDSAIRDQDGNIVAVKGFVTRNGVRDDAS